jgi:hypothetical protein
MALENCNVVTALETASFGNGKLWKCFGSALEMYEFLEVLYHANSQFSI